MRNEILITNAVNKINNIVKYGMAEGARSTTSFSVLENVDTVNKILIKAGAYVAGKYIVWSDNDIVIDTLTTPSGSDRIDLIYLDVTHDTGLPVFLVNEGSNSVPSAIEGHSFTPIWEIHRLDGNENIISSMLTDGGDPNLYDRRTIPAAVVHQHLLEDGAYDVTAKSSEVNQLITGIDGHNDVNSARIIELCESNFDPSKWNDLVGGSVISLHLHNYVNTIHASTGNALSSDSQVSIVGSGGTTTTASGSTITIHTEANYLQNPAQADLSMASKKIENLLDPTLDQDGATKKYVDSNDETIRTELKSDFVKYTNDEDRKNIDMGGTFTVINIRNGNVDSDPATVWQLNNAIDNIIDTAGLDDRYKLGHVNGINKQSAGHVSMDNYKINNLGLPTDGKDAINKDYLEDYAPTKVHDLNDHSVNTDLNMGKSGNNKLIKNLMGPVDDNDAATRKFVLDAVAGGLGAVEGDNMGDHTARLHVDFQNQYTGKNVISPVDDNDIATKKFVEDTVSGSGNLAKLGDFETRANTENLPIDVKNGGSLDIRGINGNTLLKVGKDEHGNNQILAGSRIQYVETPIAKSDAVTKDYVDTEIAKKIETLKVGDTFYAQVTNNNNRGDYGFYDRGMTMILDTILWSNFPDSIQLKTFYRQPIGLDISGAPSEIRFKITFSFTTEKKISDTWAGNGTTTFTSFEVPATIFTSDNPSIPIGFAGTYLAPKVSELDSSIGVRMVYSIPESYIGSGYGIYYSNLIFSPIVKLEIVSV